MRLLQQANQFSQLTKDAFEVFIFKEKIKIMRSLKSHEM